MEPKHLQGSCGEAETKVKKISTFEVQINFQPVCVSNVTSNNLEHTHTHTQQH